MKCLVIFLLFLAAVRVEAYEVLKCLGEEEKRYHVNKNMGPGYDLNQRLIAELVQIPNIQVAPQFLPTICDPKNFSASWKLLELSITQGKSLFVIPPAVTGMQRAITASMIDDYIEASREILIAFITQLQASAPTPDCLKREIPTLETFFFEIKHLQEDVPLNKIFQSKDRKIIDAIKDYPKAFQRCRDRLRKKPRSGSTPAARKP
jgi:hypothetical protein